MVWRSVAFHSPEKQYTSTDRIMLVYALFDLWLFVISLMICFFVFVLCFRAFCFYSLLSNTSKLQEYRKHLDHMTPTKSPMPRWCIKLGPSLEWNSHDFRKGFNKQTTNIKSAFAYKHVFETACWSRKTTYHNQTQLCFLLNQRNNYVKPYTNWINLLNLTFSGDWKATNTNTWINHFISTFFLLTFLIRFYHLKKLKKYSSWNICRLPTYFLIGLKPWLFNWFWGPRGLEKIRETCGNKFLQSWYLNSSMVPSYDPETESKIVRGCHFPRYCYILYTL